MGHLTGPVFLRKAIDSWLSDVSWRSGNQLCVLGVSSRILYFSLIERGLLAQQVMIVLGEAVRFVADVLQQAQREGVAAQAQRLFGVGAVDLFAALGQREQYRRLDVEFAKRGRRRAKLSPAAVDQHDVGKRLALGVVTPAP